MAGFSDWRSTAIMACLLALALSLSLMDVSVAPTQLPVWDRVLRIEPHVLSIPSPTSFEAEAA